MNRLKQRPGTVAVAVGIALLALVAWRFPMTFIVTALIIVAITSTLFSSLEYRWRTFTSNTPETREAISFPKLNTKRLRTRDEIVFTLIVPAYHEKGVIAHTLETLAAQEYPRGQFEILVTLRDDDPETHAAAQAVAERHPGLITVHAAHYPNRSNKSTQMNRVLKYARGRYVVPFDAEDIVAVGLLAYVEALIAETNADVVQGGVQLTNLDNETNGSWFRQLWQYMTNGWFAVHNVMEYRFWFSSRMFYQQQLGFVPLGGNTVFVRTELLRKAGEWNDKCLTEDAYLGVVLSVKHKAKIVAFYDPELATREHTPPRMFGRGSWLGQRTRWGQGFMQVMKSTPWYQLPTLRQRFMALYILGTPLLQAFNAFMLPLALVTMFTLKVPVPLALFMFVPFIPMALIMSLQLLELSAFCRDFSQAAKLRHYISLAFGFIPYQFMLGVAAVMAVIREARGVTSWSKTARSTQIHLDQTPSTEGVTA